MSGLTLLNQPESRSEGREDQRERRDRLELLTALITAPSFDALFGAEVIGFPADHPLYRWDCNVSGCERALHSRRLCLAHDELWRGQRARAGPVEAFVRAASPLTSVRRESGRCRVCPQRPAAHLKLGLCQWHWIRWWSRQRHDSGAVFADWLAAQQPRPGYGPCRARVCTEQARDPLGLCLRHYRHYCKQGRPGAAVLPHHWGKLELEGHEVVAVNTDAAAFRSWCDRAAPVSRPGELNLTGVPALMRAEIQWGLFDNTRVRHARWPVPTLQKLAELGRRQRKSSLLELSCTSRTDPVGRVVRAITARLELIYTPVTETRERGHIDAAHFGRTFPKRASRIDLTAITQRWLRDLLWDHFAAVLRSPRCPRSGGTFDFMTRSVIELSAFLELHAPTGGHDPAVLHAELVHQLLADQLHRDQHQLPSIALTGIGGKPSLITERSRTKLGWNLRRLLRGTLESGQADRLGLDRGFITAFPSPGRERRRTRTPFPDQIADALADETNLTNLAVGDPMDLGARDVWETLLATGRRAGEVLGLRLDCLGRYGGVPRLWHDQTKVGNHDQSIRIPEQLYGRLEARQATTLARFVDIHGRPPTADERKQLVLFPSPIRNPDGRRPVSNVWFGDHFKAWVDEMNIGRWVPHQARHSLATNLLRAGASLAHVRDYLGHISERMTETYIQLSGTEVDDALDRIWVAGPGSHQPGKLLTDPAHPLTPEQARSLAIDLTRRSTPAEGGFCTFQPVVDGGACPWNLDCHHCDKFVLSGADLLYWRRKREHWRQLAEAAPDDATADYLHRCFDPTARAIDGLEAALAGVGLLDDALALDLRKPQDYFHRVWSTAFRATALAPSDTPALTADNPGAIGDTTDEPGIVAAAGDGAAPGTRSRDDAVAST